MIKKKNGFMTFICSLMPGAGEMYLGFMKEGLSIMCLTFGMFIGSTFLNIDWFIYGVIIIWFYSLFNVHNKVSLPDEEFYTLEDNYNGLAQTINTYLRTSDTEDQQQQEE